MFGGGEEVAEASVGDVEQWRHMWGARVKWPVEMPDDILKHSIGTWRRSLFVVARGLFWRVIGAGCLSSLWPCKRTTTVSRCECAGKDAVDFQYLHALLIRRRPRCV